MELFLPCNRLYRLNEHKTRSYVLTKCFQLSYNKCKLIKKLK